MAKLDLGTLYFSVDADLKGIAKQLTAIKKLTKDIDSTTQALRRFGTESVKMNKLATVSVVKAVAPQKKLKASIKQTTKALKDSATAAKNSKMANDSLAKSLASTALRAFGIYSAFQLSKKAAMGFVKIADEFNLLNDRLKIATKLTGDYVNVQQKLIDIGRETGASLKINVGLFQNFARSAPDLQATNEEMLTLISSVNKIAAVSGASATDLKFALRQFSQAMAAGIVRAEEFNSIVENTPELAAKIASGMGMTVGKLRLAVLEGTILSKDVFATLLKQTKEIDAEFAEMPVRMGRAWGIFQSELQQSIGLLNEYLGITAGLVKVLGGASGVLEKINKSVTAKDSGTPERLEYLDKEINRLKAVKKAKLDAAKASNSILRVGPGGILQNKKNEIKSITEIYTKLLDTLQEELDRSKKKKLKDEKKLSTATLAEAMKTLGGKIKLENDFKEIKLSIDKEIAFNKIKTEREMLEAVKESAVLEGEEKKKLTEAIIALQEKEKKFKKDTVDENIDNVKASNARLLAIQTAQNEAMKKLDDSKYVAPEKSELTTGLPRLKGTSTELDDRVTIVAAIVEKTKGIWAEFSSWFGQNDEDILLETKRKLEEELELEQNNADAKKAIKKELADVEKKLIKDTFLFQSGLSKQEMKTAKDVSSFILDGTRDTLAKTAEYSKTAFELQKGIALANIAIKTSEAYMAAMTITPPLGQILAGAALAAGAAQGALVMSQSFPGKEAGGMIGANSTYRVNESGPEMLSIGGKDFLMTGSQGGNITPNDKISSGTSTGSSKFPKVTVNIVTAEGTTATVEQKEQGDELQINAIIERIDNATAQGIRSGLSETSGALSDTFGLNRGVGSF